MPSLFAAFLATALSIADVNLATQNLNGEPRMFPGDVAQDRAVVVLTFSKSASDEASLWTQKLRGNQGESGTGIYQIAVLEDVPALFRSFVISALRQAVPRQLHDTFWIATSGSKQWQERTGAAADDRAHVFVLEDRKQIVWGFHGAFSEFALRSLLTALSVQKN